MLYDCPKCGLPAELIATLIDENDGDPKLLLVFSCIGQRHPSPVVDYDQFSQNLFDK